MNDDINRHELERVFFRSCLESAPHRKVLPQSAQAPTRPPGGRTQVQLHLLKQRLLHAALDEVNEAGLSKRICGAANQAAELAWETNCPLLVFPCLFEDLAELVRESGQTESPGLVLESNTDGRSAGQNLEMAAFV